MESARARLHLSAASLLLVLPLAASAQTPGAPRADLDVVAAALDRAVAGTRTPGAPWVAGVSGTRAYLLPGVGAMFVLPPRGLPGTRVKLDTTRHTARALADAMAHLQETLRRAREPELRAQIERSLESVRRAQAELRAGKRVAVPVPPVPVAPPADVFFPNVGEIAAAVNEQVAEEMRALEALTRAKGEASAAWRESYEAQVRALMQQTDAFRKEAEEARLEAERTLREQLAAWPQLPPPPAAPAAPAPTARPAPPAPAAPAAPSAEPAPPAPPAAAAPPAWPTPPAFGPWIEWFGVEEDDAGEADALVTRVREAVLGVLDAEAARLARAGAGGSVAVAVDFVPRGVTPRRPSRTLVLRASQRDLEARAAGRLGAAEFRSRVEASEY